MSNYPESLTKVNHVAPAPRRVRALVGGETVLDTTRAVYVWELPYFPLYYVPRDDVRMDLLEKDGDEHDSPQGKFQSYALRVNGRHQPRAARLIVDSAIGGLQGMVRFDWHAADQWFEEDEEIFVHPRSPYTRVDALRSMRSVRVALDGVVLAESPAPVMLYETGLPTRYYVDQSCVRFEHLKPSDTRSECPYKGRTTGYWSVSINGNLHEDLAWCYSFPTRQLTPISGLVAFLNEKVDIFIDGVAQERPKTNMS